MLKPICLVLLTNKEHIFTMCIWHESSVLTCCRLQQFDCVIGLRNKKTSDVRCYATLSIFLFNRNLGFTKYHDYMLPMHDDALMRWCIIAQNVCIRMQFIWFSNVGLKCCPACRSTYHRIWLPLTHTTCYFCLEPKWSRDMLIKILQNICIPLPADRYVQLCWLCLM